MMIRILAFACLLSATACTTKQISVPSPMSTLAETTILTLEEPLTVKVSRAQSLTLQQDSTWSLVGELPQGKVLKPLDQVVVINSFNVYEGYIVVSDDELVGFYLPVTKGFVEAGPTGITLLTQEE